MGRLIYSMFTSLDGYVRDRDGNFGWAVPDEETHTFVNDLYRPVGTYLYGRRMYETMVFLGDGAHAAGRAAVRRRLHARLAGRRQDRLLHDAGRGDE